MKLAIAAVFSLLFATFIATAEVPKTDARVSIELEQEQKLFVLMRMRKMLETLTEMQILMLEEKPEKTHEVVLELMRFTQQNHPRGMHDKMPDAFRAMARQMNGSWKKLAQPQTDAKVIQQEIVQIMASCNGCHQTFRIE